MKKKYEEKKYRTDTHRTQRHTVPTHPEQITVMIQSSKVYNYLASCRYLCGPHARSWRAAKIRQNMSRNNSSMRRYAAVYNALQCTMQ